MANHRGGSVNFAEDRSRASKAGHKGANKAAGISEMIRSGPRKQVKKEAKTAMVGMVGMVG